jgi:hypothetical protein
MPAEINKPLRITLTLATKRGDIVSLDPLWKALLSQTMFEMARRQRARSQGSFVILSDQADLSITFPHLQDSVKTFAAGCVVGSAIGFILFRFGVAPLLWVPVMGALGGLAGILISRSTATEATVRGDLPDIMAVSDALALWLSGQRKRKIRLETWEKVRLEIDARTPQEVQAMLKTALAMQEEEPDSAGSTA